MNKQIPFLIHIFLSLKNRRLFQKFHFRKISFPYDCQPFWERYYIKSPLWDSCQCALYLLIAEDIKSPEETPHFLASYQEESLLLILPFLTKELAFFKWLARQHDANDIPLLKNILILENHLLLHLPDKATLLFSLNCYIETFLQDSFPALPDLKNYLSKEQEKISKAPVKKSKFSTKKQRIKKANASKKRKMLLLPKRIALSLLFACFFSVLAGALSISLKTINQKAPARNKESPVTILPSAAPSPAAGFPSSKASYKTFSSPVYFIHMEKKKLHDLNTLQPHAETTELRLSDNMLSDIGKLSSFPLLKTLYLENNMLSDISPLGESIHLQYLYLGNNRIGELSSLHKLIALKELYLNDNRIKDISPLRQLSSLYILLLQNNDIRDVSPLGQCPALEYLDLSGNKNLQNTESLKELYSLTFLNLINTNISSENLQLLQRALPNCHILHSL